MRSTLVSRKINLLNVWAVCKIKISKIVWKVYLIQCNRIFLENSIKFYCSLIMHGQFNFFKISVQINITSFISTYKQNLFHIYVQTKLVQQKRSLEDQQTVKWVHIWQSRRYLSKFNVQHKLLRKKNKINHYRKITHFYHALSRKNKLARNLTVSFFQNKLI